MPVIGPHMCISAYGKSKGHPAFSCCTVCHTDVLNSLAPTDKHSNLLTMLDWDKISIERQLRARRALIPYYWALTPYDWALTHYYWALKGKSGPKTSWFY